MKTKSTFILLFLIAGCAVMPKTNVNVAESTLSGIDEKHIIIHAMGDPSELTPLNSFDNAATTVFHNVFQTLLHIDFKTYDIVPVLAKARPVFTNMSDGKLKVDFEIREEAKWDNGKPITGHDVDFTLRVLLNPKTDSRALKPYFEKIEHIIIDKDNPRKFSLIYSEPYMIIEAFFSDLYIIPAYIYDPEGIMQKFTLNQLFEQGEALSNDDDIKKFADQYNSIKFQREVVVGSGAYTFEDWQTNMRIILKRKDNWWGDAVKDVNHWLRAYPDKLTFETIGPQVFR